MTVVTIVLSIACFIVGGFASYLFFKHGLKNKYDGILRDAEAEAEVIKKNKLLEVKEKFLNKKADLEKEVAALGAKIEQKQIEFDVLSERVLNYDKAKDELSNLEIELDTAPKYQLPEPEKFMTAKAYKTKMAEPVVRKLKQLVKTVLARCFEGWDNYHRLNTANAQLYRTNQRLEKVNERLTEENKILKAENKDYSLLRKVFGRKQIDDLLEQARTVKGRKRDNTRSR